MALALVIPLWVAANLAVGLIVPTAMERAMQPLPQIAGAAGAAMGRIQMATSAAASGLVAILCNGHAAPAMTTLLTVFARLALASHLLLTRKTDGAAPL